MLFDNFLQNVHNTPPFSFNSSHPPIYQSQEVFNASRYLMQYSLHIQ
jgi:hypothetical protein